MSGITIQSSIFYSFEFLIIYFNCILAEKYREKMFVYFSIAIPTIVAGFRSYSVGQDTPAYVQLFKEAYAGITFQKDPGFSLICSFLLHIFNNPTFLFLTFGFLIYSLIAMRLWELRDVVSFKFSYMAFLCFYYFETMNCLRQFIAVAILFWASRYLMQGKYVKYICFIFVAYVFHVTALLGFLSFFGELYNWKLLEKKQKRFIMVMIIVGACSSSYVINYMINRTVYYMHYFKHMVVDVGFRLYALLGIFILSILVFDNYRSDIYQPNGIKEIYLLSTTRLYYIFALLLSSAGYFFPYMERLGWTYVLFEGVYYGMLVNERKKLRRWILKIPIIIIMLYILLNYLFFKNGSNHHPYSFVWD